MVSFPRDAQRSVWSAYIATAECCYIPSTTEVGIGDCHSTVWKQILRSRDLTDHVIHCVVACLMISKITLVRLSTN